MPDDLDDLGGRTALLAPESMTAAQRRLYEDINSDMVPWAERSGFQARLADGRLIGPFNTILLSPEMGGAFVRLQAVEATTTSLSQRVRQVVILTVGAVWKCDYERYAHAAVAKQAGLSSSVVDALRGGAAPDGLSEDEDIARRFTLSLTADRQVDDTLFGEARATFGDRGIVEIVILAGCYDLVSSLLNAFKVPAPRS